MSVEPGIFMTARSRLNGGQSSGAWELTLYVSLSGHEGNGVQIEIKQTATDFLLPHARLWSAVVTCYPNKRVRRSRPQRTTMLFAAVTKIRP